MDVAWVVGLVAVVLLVLLAWAWRSHASRAATRTPPREVPRGKLDHLSRAQRIAKYGHKFVTIRGDVVQSGPERRIADFLHRKGVDYVYEAQLHGASPDFYLPAHHIIIEHWGMEHPRYLQRRWEKARMYHAKGYVLVETEKKDVPRLERVLEERLRRAAPRIFDASR